MYTQIHISKTYKTYNKYKYPKCNEQEVCKWTNNKGCENN